MGFVSMPVSGHLNPMTALARKLQSRGNDVVLIGVPDVEPFARAANLDFVSFCEKEYPSGSIAELWAQMAKLHGLDVVKYSLERFSPGLVAAAMEHLPRTIAEAGIEALVLDTVYFFLELVPISLGIPYVQASVLLNLDLSSTTPPCLFGSPHETTSEALARNAQQVQSAGQVLVPIIERAALPYAKKTGLEIDWSDPTSTSSKLAILSQIPREFDYPGIPWPPQFHYTGPFHDDRGRQPVPFPWEQLNGKPLVYASMGTLVNGLEDVYKTILAAVGPMSDVQLVLSAGKNVNLDDLGPVPSNTIIVSAAPQIELLRRATLCITHAGLNTAMESLAQGVPMVAIPIGYDQPGVAARIAYHGAGEVVQIEDLTVERLAELVQRVRTNESYREKARYFQKVIAETRGLDVAAELIEEAIAKSQIDGSADDYAEVFV